MNKQIHKRTLYVAELSLFIAVELLLAFTPLGYLQTPWGFAITFMVVPIAIAGIILGPVAGAATGLVFGITSFIQCLGGSPMGVILMQASPVGTFFVTIVPRILVGLLPALLYRALAKRKKGGVFSIGLCCLLTPLCNTLLFMTSVYACFSNTYLGLMQNIGYQGGTGLSLLFFMLGAVVINGVAEAVSCLVLATPVCKVLQKTVNRVRI